MIEPLASPSPVPSYNRSRDDCISVSISRINMMAMQIVTMVLSIRALSDQGLLAGALEDGESKMRDRRWGVEDGGVSSQHRQSRASIYAAKMHCPPFRYLGLRTLSEILTSQLEYLLTKELALECWRKRNSV